MTNERHDRDRVPREPSRDSAERANLLRLAQSYFVKRILASRSTPHNPLLEVVYVNGRCVLNARSVNYSFGSLHRVFEEAFEKLRLERREIGDVLVLGCGAGSVVQILRAKYSKDCAITAVEIDPVVIELAREHFLIDRVPGLEIVCMDAAEYVANSVKAFDLVVIDLFVDDRVPEPFRRPEFVRRVGELVRSGGLLVFNVIDDDEETRVQAEELAAVFERVLPPSRSIDLDGNRILVHERIE